MPARAAAMPNRPVRRPIWRRLALGAAAGGALALSGTSLPAWVAPPAADEGLSRRAGLAAILGTAAGPQAALAMPGTYNVEPFDRGDAEWGSGGKMKIRPPKPDPNPYIAALQKKSWEMEPYIRTRLYLKAADSKLQDLSPRFFVRWANNEYKFDVLEENNLKEANQMGKVQIDPKLSDPTMEMTVFIYTNKEAQEFVQKSIGAVDVAEVPDELKKSLETMKLNKFGVDPAGSPAAAAPAAAAPAEYAAAPAA
mmetsp:Transcript_3598/g.10432  ORF Transcript_3598/g.10432 Transcript_3598/m.10432 type:complete len:253 (-) Transcript_3598:34-792(-)